ncbi:MAG TPA: PAS domain S-box protein [Anaerolineales bacterium]|nr:PAS domain S-box protein [Anaerolineales bacterium]
MDDKTIPNATYQAAQSTQEQPRPAAWGDDFHYRALFEQSDDSIFIISLGLRYMAANPQALQLLGYTESELVGKPVSEIMALDESLSNATVLDDSSNLVERILRCKDGTLVPVEISTSIVYDGHGQPAYIQSIVRDITRRKEVERLLKRRNQLMASINNASSRLLQSTRFENNTGAVLESIGQAASASACFIIEIKLPLNPASLNILFQWKKESSAGLDIAASLVPWMKAILNSQAALLAENLNFPMARSMAIVQVADRQTSRLFLGLFYLEKKEAWLPAQRDALQIAASLIGAAWQRNQHELAILASEARNRTIIEALPDLIIRMDAHGRIMDYNARPDHPLFQPHDAVAGKLLSEIWPEDVAAQIMGGGPGTTFSEPHLIKEFRLPFSQQVYEARFAPIGSYEALLVVRDITEQARLNEMKSDFINRASHELRMPLTNAILMVNLIQEGGSPDELKEYWSILTSELDRQKVLIERLLVAGRLESHALKLEVAPMDLVPILNESVLAVKLFANKKNIDIRLSLPGGEAMIQGDKSGLQQVFINLINNAVKFSPRGSSVDVNVLSEPEAVRVAITDHGMGIPAEDIPHLCERFFRGRNVTIAEIPGSGIGLYIVKSIVEELGGNLKIESIIKQGTTITVSLKHAESLSGA